MRQWLSRRGIRFYTICDDYDGRLWRYGRVYLTLSRGDEYDYSPALA